MKKIGEINGEDCSHRWTIKIEIVGDSVRIEDNTRMKSGGGGEDSREAVLIEREEIDRFVSLLEKAKGELEKRA